MPAALDPQMAPSAPNAHDPNGPEPRPFQAPIPAMSDFTPTIGSPPTYDPNGGNYGGNGGNVAGAAIWTAPGTTVVYDHDDDHRPSAGAIAGCVIGALAILALLFLIYRFIKKRRSGMPPAAAASGGFMSGFRESNDIYQTTSNAKRHETK
ncbi:MAG: hypothetical protein L6R37_003116 [Teloschistes peruensis]|nr:MAG: hypothetical protein L6R37_003116 [Teloschistes peruensis]